MSPIFLCLQQKHGYMVILVILQLKTDFNLIISQGLIHIKRPEDRKADLYELDYCIVN